MPSAPSHRSSSSSLSAQHQQEQRRRHHQHHHHNRHRQSHLDEDGSRPSSAHRAENMNNHNSGALLVPPLPSSPSGAAGLMPSAAPTVDALVEHLLAAKRSLSSVGSVLRANEVVTAARAALEDAGVRSAQAAFLRRTISDQRSLLVRLRRCLQITYDSRRRRWTRLLRTMDAANQRLQDSMQVLRTTPVQPQLRPEGEEPRTLIDFVDEQAVIGLLDTMKRGLADLQLAQQSFDGDLLRFDIDIRSLHEVLAAASAPPRPRSSYQQQQQPPPPQQHSQTPDSGPDLLASLTVHSRHMAELLTGLTRHFDLCVTAVRITDGGTAVARRRAAEDAKPDEGSGGGGSGTGGTDVSISGVIARQESAADDRLLSSPGLEPMTIEERSDMMRVVVADAAEVDDVVGEINDRLALVEEESVRLHDHAARARAGHAAALLAYRTLEDIGSRLGTYVEAEQEFVSRWQLEQDSIGDRLGELEALHELYLNYARAYGSLIPEVARRRGFEDRVAAVWAKAHESVAKMTESELRRREAFMLQVGEFLPTDLWHDVQGGVARWEVVPVRETTTMAPIPEGDGGGGGPDSAATAAAK